MTAEQRSRVAFTACGNVTGEPIAARRRSDPFEWAEQHHRPPERRGAAPVRVARALPRSVFWSLPYGRWFGVPSTYKGAQPSRTFRGDLDARVEKGVRDEGRGLAKGFPGTAGRRRGHRRRGRARADPLRAPGRPGRSERTRPALVDGHRPAALRRLSIHGGASAVHGSVHPGALRTGTDGVDPGL